MNNCILKQYYLDVTQRERYVAVKSSESVGYVDIPMAPVDRILACYRENSCWMTAVAVTDWANIPDETQYLLTREGDEYAVYFSLVEGTLRAYVEGIEGGIRLHVETGDSATPIGEGRALYVIKGADPYDLIREGYERVSADLGTVTLMRDKKIPEFVDRLGFCTYNAFYEEVTDEKVLAIAKGFKEHGLSLGFIIMDAGWQTYVDSRIVDFLADSTKFPGGLKKLIDKLKGSYGVQKVLCWHTFYGYWKGVLPERFEGYDVTREYFRISDKFNTFSASGEPLNTAGSDFYPQNLMGEEIGFTNDIRKLYDDYYAEIKRQGADGTKLDAMTWIEAFGEGKGGRVRLMRELVGALESASNKHFGGEHINCSSCSNDFFWNVGSGSVTRSSGDYFPEDRASHGKHVYTNAVVSLFTSPVILPDWDMFQSGFGGRLHAVARAMSGGPVYTTDDLSTIDFDIIKRLCASDGRVPRCLDSAVPAPISLFENPYGDKPFVIKNRNRYGYVLTAFNLREGESTQIEVALSECGAKEGTFAVWSDVKGFVGVMRVIDAYVFEVEGYGAEILHVVPIVNGVAVAGLVDKYNSVGYVESIDYKDGKTHVRLMEAGRCSVYVDGEGLKEYHTKSFSI